MPTVPPVSGQEGRWFVEVEIEEPSRIRTRFLLGPIAGWTESRGVAKKWEAEFGPDTAEVIFRRPYTKQRTGDTPVIGRPLHGGRCPGCGFTSACYCVTAPAPT